MYIELSAKILPANVTQIISGGARGIDTVARDYDLLKSIDYLEFKPDHEKIRTVCSATQNKEIVDGSGVILAIWDGQSKGTKHTLNYAKKVGVAYKIIRL